MIIEAGHFGGALIAQSVGNKIKFYKNFWKHYPQNIMHEIFSKITDYYIINTLIVCTQ